MMTATVLPPTAEELDPHVGFFKRRALRRQRLGIVTIGPRGPAPIHQPTRVERVITARQEGAQERARRADIEAELAAIDAHAARIEQMIGEPARGQAVGPGAGDTDYATQEMRSELGSLAALRLEIESDLDFPIRNDRDGRAINDRQRQMARARSSELRELLWAQAGMAAGQGDHRRARQLRVDALRARHIAEFEQHLRPSLRGYSFCG